MPQTDLPYIWRINTIPSAPYTAASAKCQRLFPENLWSLISINQSEGRFYAGSPGVEFRFVQHPHNQRG